jgi:hypothetical protein
MKTFLLPYTDTSANQIPCVKISRYMRESHAPLKYEIADSLAKFTGITIAIGSSMKTIIRNLLAAMLLMAFSFQSHAQGTLIDQESDASPINPLGNNYVDGLDLSDEPVEIFTQSFVPSQSAIDFVSLEFENGTGAASVYVNIYSSSPTAQPRNLIGSTETVNLPSGFENNGLFDAGVATFDFATPITLTAGDTYYFEAVCSSGGAQWAVVDIINDTYPNGVLYAEGNVLQPPSDFWFQEGINAVPEPTTLTLIGIGILAFTFRHRLKPKLPVLVFASILFTVPVLSVNASDVSIVAATAENAGLCPVSVLPETGGTYWITSINPNGGLTALPYPMLPTDMSGLSACFVTNLLFTPCKFF